MAKSRADLVEIFIITCDKFSLRLTQFEWNLIRFGDLIASREERTEIERSFLFFDYTVVFLVMCVCGFSMYTRYVAITTWQFLTFTSRRKNKPYRPPGHLILSILSAIFPQKVFEVHFGQTIADMREEANELDAEGRTAKRRWIVFCYHLALGFNVAAFVVLKMVKRVTSLWAGL